MTNTSETESGTGTIPTGRETEARRDGELLVADALDDIDATRSRIGEELAMPRDSAEVTAATDEALVYVAERTLQSPEASLAQKQDAVDDVAIETALEIDGGIDAARTPVAEFEFKGYGDSIDDVVKRLHESHATLPNGHEAAPLVMKAVDELAGRNHELARDQGATATLEYIEADETLAASVERSANYAGNWTECQTDRMTSQDFMDRFARFTRYGAEGLENDAPTGFLVKKAVSQSDYLKRIGDLPQLVQTTSSRIEYIPAIDIGMRPTQLGTVAERGGEMRVALFKDAESGGRPLDDRQKDIITAHEMYHRIVSPDGLNVGQIRNAFDVGTLYDKYEKLGTSADISQKYLQSPHELTARMAQVKNYFGMQGDEPFTREHLAYAREHYVADTGMDNSMTEFFAMAKDGAFVELMNTLPI